MGRGKTRRGEGGVEGVVEDGSVCEDGNQSGGGPTNMVFR